MRARAPRRRPQSRQRRRPRFTPRPARGPAHGCAPRRWPRARPLPAPAAPRAPDSFVGDHAPRWRTRAPLAAPAVRPAPRTGGRALHRAPAVRPAPHTGDPARTRFLRRRPRSVPCPGRAPCALPAVRMPIFRRKTTGFWRKMDFQICEPFPSGFHWNPADSARNSIFRPRRKAISNQKCNPWCIQDLAMVGGKK